MSDAPTGDVAVVGASGDGGQPARGGQALRELAALFLKLGVIGFGGPAAHVALMEDEVVRRRGWMTRARFLDLLGATNLIPGPNSTEMAIHVGQARAGLPGLLVAGACFIVPASAITLAIAWAYVRYGALPGARGLLHGVKPVIIAVVLQALVALARTAVKRPSLAAIGVAAAAAEVATGRELAVLLGAGLVAVLLSRPARGDAARAALGVAAAASTVGRPARAAIEAGLGSATGPGPAGTALSLATVAGAAVAAPLAPLFLVFLKVGAVLFGSGYVLLAFLRADLVDRLHWLGEAQLLDAVAVGQITPGPVFSTATFIGYLLAGTPGAAAATVGIFLPAFVFVALSGPLVPRLRASPVAGAFLDGVNVASLALMAVVTFHLGRAALVDVPTVLLAIASAIALLRFRLNSAWLVAAGAFAGLLLG